MAVLIWPKPNLSLEANNIRDLPPLTIGSGQNFLSSGLRRSLVLAENTRRIGRGGLLHPGTQKVELLVLSQSRDLTIRRLRGFAASLGASANLFSDYAGLKTALEALEGQPTENRRRPIIVWDRTSVGFRSGELAALRAKYQVFVSTESSHEAIGLVEPHPETAQGHHLTASLKRPPDGPGPCLTFGWPLSRLLDSHLARVAFFQAFIAQGTLSFTGLLRWGHVSMEWEALSNPTWSRDSGASPHRGLAHTAGEFSRHIGLKKVVRESIFTFIKALEHGARKSVLTPHHISFVADGLLTCVTAECRGNTALKADWWWTLLQSTGCHAILVHQGPDDSWQVAAVYFQTLDGSTSVPPSKSLFLFMTDRREHTGAVTIPENLGVAS